MSDKEDPLMEKIFKEIDRLTDTIELSPLQQMKTELERLLLARSPKHKALHSSTELEIVYVLDYREDVTVGDNDAFIDSDTVGVFTELEGVIKYIEDNKDYGGDNSLFVTETHGWWGIGAQVLNPHKYDKEVSVDGGFIGMLGFFDMDGKYLGLKQPSY